MHSAILFLHICGGTFGMVSGFVAVFLRKGSRQHGIVGNVFVASMLILSATGTYLAFLKSEPDNFIGGALTGYLVATAWMTARSRDGETNLRDWGAFLLASAIGTVAITYGIRAATSPVRHSAGPYFFLGSIPLLAAAGDLRMLMRGISARQRVARHLWRMCFALFVASVSIFSARAHLFPVLLRKTGVLSVLSFLPLGLLVFWMCRVRFAKQAIALYPARTRSEFMRVQP